MPLSHNISSVWKEDSGVWVNISGVWKVVEQISVRESGVWFDTAAWIINLIKSRKTV